MLAGEACSAHSRYQQLRRHRRPGPRNFKIIVRQWCGAHDSYSIDLPPALVQRATFSDATVTFTCEVWGHKQGVIGGSPLFTSVALAYTATNIWCRTPCHTVTCLEWPHQRARARCGSAHWRMDPIPREGVSGPGCRLAAPRAVSVMTREQRTSTAFGGSIHFVSRQTTRSMQLCNSELTGPAPPGAAQTL